MLSALPFFAKPAIDGNFSGQNTVQFPSARDSIGSRKLPRKVRVSMSMTPGSRHGAEINVTPLIDVLLVLLIIFMVIVPPHNLGEKADIPLPARIDTPPSERQETIVLQLHGMGEGKQPTLQINQQHVS